MIIGDYMSTIKNLAKFWWLKEYMVDKGYTTFGHSLFSLGHILWLAIIILFTVLISKSYKNAKESKRTTIRRIFAILVFLLEYVKLVVIALVYPIYINQYVPLHLCSVAGILILFDGLWPNRKFVNYLWPFVVLASGVMSVLSPGTTYPHINFFSIHTFLFHGILIIYSIMKIVSGESKVSYKALWISALFAFIYAIPIYFIDITFDQGYMFLIRPSDFPLLLIWNKSTKILGQVGYLASLALISLLVLHIIYLVFKVIERIKKK